jgi:hypothetical protein
VSLRQKSRPWVSRHLSRTRIRKRPVKRTFRRGGAHGASAVSGAAQTDSAADARCLGVGARCSGPHPRQFRAVGARRTRRGRDATRGAGEREHRGRDLRTPKCERGDATVSRRQSVFFFLRTTRDERGDLPPQKRENKFHFFHIRPASALAANGMSHTAHTPPLLTNCVECAVLHREHSTPTSPEDAFVVDSSRPGESLMDSSLRFSFVSIDPSLSLPPPGRSDRSVAAHTHPGRSFFWMCSSRVSSEDTL